jgi:uncharacterized membrane protein YgcG
MGLIRSLPARGRMRTWLAAPMVAALFLVLTVAPVAAERGPVRLTDPSVSPVQVKAGQPVTFSAVYSNGTGNGPASIVVKVGSTTYPMSPPPGTTNYGGGVTYSVTATPPAGTWSVTFVATDKFGNVATLSGATLTVIAPPPAPTPTPTAKPTPTPTPKPTPTPTPKPTPTSTPVAPGAGTGAPGAGSGSGSSGSGSSGSGGSGGSGSGSPTDGAPAEAWVVTSGGTAGTATSSDTGIPPWQIAALYGADPGGIVPTAGTGDGSTTAAANDATVGSSTTTLPGRDDRKGSGSLAGGGATSSPGTLGPTTASAFGGLPGSDGSVPIDRILTTIVVTMGGVAMTMAFMLFGRRRRDDDPPDSDEALAAAAASGPAALASASLLGMGGAIPSPVAVAPAPDAELDLPRWRRPSLLAARKEDPLRAVHADAPLTFDHGAVAPIDGVERRVIRYRLVRLLDSPDELIAGEIGSLDEGDEVQLLQRSGAYWLVLCPDGGQGWVHRMVLGDVVDEGSSIDEPAPPSPPARSPLPGERLDGSFLSPRAGIRLSSQGTAAWSLQGAGDTDAGTDIDDDVLRAYLASRGRI